VLCLSVHVYSHYICVHIFQSNEGVFANILTVRSSLDVPGVHQISHQMKNLKTGGSKMIINDTVDAKKVVTKFKSAEINI